MPSFKSQRNFVSRKDKEESVLHVNHKIPSFDTRLRSTPQPSYIIQTYDRGTWDFSTEEEIIKISKTSVGDIRSRPSKVQTHSLQHRCLPHRSNTKDPRQQTNIDEIESDSCDTVEYEVDFCADNAEIPQNGLAIESDCMQFARTTDGKDSSVFNHYHPTSSTPSNHGLNPKRDITASCVSSRMQTSDRLTSLCLTSANDNRSHNSDTAERSLQAHRFSKALSSNALRPVGKGQQHFRKTTAMEMLSLLAKTTSKLDAFARDGSIAEIEPLEDYQQFMEQCRQLKDHLQVISEMESRNDNIIHKSSEQTSHYFLYHGTSRMTFLTKAICAFQGNDNASRNKVFGFIRLPNHEDPLKASFSGWEHSTQTHDLLLDPNYWSNQVMTFAQLEDYDIQRYTWDKVHGQQPGMTIASHVEPRLMLWFACEMVKKYIGVNISHERMYVKYFRNLKEHYKDLKLEADIVLSHCNGLMCRSCTELWKIIQRATGIKFNIKMMPNAAEVFSSRNARTKANKMPLYTSMPGESDYESDEQDKTHRGKQTTKTLTAKACEVVIPSSPLTMSPPTTSCPTLASDLFPVIAREASKKLKRKEHRKYVNRSVHEKVHSRSYATSPKVAPATNSAMRSDHALYDTSSPDHEIHSNPKARHRALMKSGLLSRQKRIHEHKRPFEEDSDDEDYVPSKLARKEKHKISRYSKLQNSSPGTGLKRKYS